MHDPDELDRRQEAAEATELPGEDDDSDEGGDDSGEEHSDDDNAPPQRHVRARTQSKFSLSHT